MDINNVEQMIEDSKNASMEELFPTHEPITCDKCQNIAKYSFMGNNLCEDCSKQIFEENKFDIAIQYIDEYLDQIVYEHSDDILEWLEVKEVNQ